jgi:Protein of unknown function (DUF4242)
VKYPDLFAGADTESARKLACYDYRMPKFLIEREIPGAGQMTPEQVQGVAQKSLSVLRDLGPQIQWLHSYVTDNKVYCVYWAPTAEIIEEHARRCGVPANRISAVRRLMDPVSAEGN